MSNNNFSKDDVSLHLLFLSLVFLLAVKIAFWSALNEGDCENDLYSTARL
jgi:hypothetical protein